jgi:5-methyltetrahydropteroyltriglutamate--homocysteine methyltransferase
LGYPRIGARRELKKATESYWRGEISEQDLLKAASDLRKGVYATLRDAGVDEIPSNTFSFYDHIADAIALFNAVPQRHQRGSDLATFFAMTRGDDEALPLEMTKWFDTNYHYLVPELSEKTEFRLVGDKPIVEFNEAKELDITTRPVIIGPVSFLLLSKPAPDADKNFDPLSLLDSLTDAYAELLEKLSDAGAEWVQLDEPAFVQDRSAEEIAALTKCYERLGAQTRRPKIMVASYFGYLGNAFDAMCSCPVEGIGIDLSSRGAKNLDAITSSKALSAKRVYVGVVDGRNVWINDYAKSVQIIDEVKKICNDVVVSTSCSLLHVPIDVDGDDKIDSQVVPWLAFANQKVNEVVTLAKCASGGKAANKEVEVRNALLQQRQESDFVVDKNVRYRIASLDENSDRRLSPFADRDELQRKQLQLPLLPTTTIGSFPQTKEIRASRAAFTKGEIDRDAYEKRIKEEIAHVVALQEDIGLDVLVHGEAERNDMVQYFGEQLNGCVFTDHGWVQSYGSRYVRPPIIAGDIHREKEMTVPWSTYAQSLTEKPMKGMLTGPVTMLCWSFVRDDISWADVAFQMALALRDEVDDLERAGLNVIQVDEPALREGLPLREADQQSYLDAATKAFRLTTSGVNDSTQIHTHMCYAEFGEIVDAVAALDADVISLEATRSKMSIADDLQGNYKANVGPGVYDIHSPRVPSQEEIEGLLRHALERLDKKQLWVNPDCGLKTRGEKEVVASLTNMVNAAKALRN